MTQQLNPALAAFYAQKAKEARRVPPTAARTNVAGELQALLGAMQARAARLAAADTEVIAAESELRTFLDIARASDRVANDNGAWTKARRAASQPALRPVATDRTAFSCRS